MAPLDVRRPYVGALVFFHYAEFHRTSADANGYQIVVETVRAHQPAIVTDVYPDDPLRVDVAVFVGPRHYIPTHESCVGVPHAPIVDGVAQVDADELDPPLGPRRVGKGASTWWTWSP